MSAFYGSLELRGNGALKLYEASANGTNSISLLSPASVAADLSFTMPGTDTADGVMKSNGSGVLSLAKITNANVDAAAAIAYSKLSLTGSIVNADIGASAAIAFSKLAALTDGNILVGNASNVATSVAVSGDVVISNAGVTSISSGVIVNADVNASAAIAYSKLNLSASIVNADIAAGAAIVYSKLSIADGDLTIAKTSGLQTALDGKVADTGDTMTGNLVLDNEKEVRFREATGNGTNYVGLKAAATLAGDLTYTLPDAAPASNGYVLASTTAGVMSWVSNASTSSASDTWTTGEGVLNSGLYEFTFSHGLASDDILVQVYDIANKKNIQVADIERTTTNAIKVYATEDANATGWRILVVKV